jgi:acetyl-CoA carboxylase biotin carboxylase subunit
VFRKILIANRGEIAVRIIRACRELNISTVAIYSQADETSLHVRLADEAVCVGPPPATESYAHLANVISAAIITGCDAVHPGYGFLAENASFAEACEACGIKFIGPAAAVIERMGDKAAARALMREAGVPVVPGTTGTLQNEQEAVRFAARIGYPLIVKAAAGGGGKGMRIVHTDEGLLDAVKIAQAEAAAAFGNPQVYLEKYVEEPRHIEFQILADEHGHIIHLGERDCSIQRSHQKLVEEAPAAALTKAQRNKMGDFALKAARAAGYTNAGTIEFLLERGGSFYFLEMNTRIQVEHPVTEAITGMDLVRQQILIAAGEPLRLHQRDVETRGHAIECRINAEDAERNFAPSAGKIENVILPGGYGVRVDTHVYSGYTVPTYYDSLLAKLIVWGNDRGDAIARMSRCLEEFHVEGIRTTVPFHQRVMENAWFRRGEVYTNFVRRRMTPDER